PTHAPSTLTPMEERCELLHEAGADGVIVVHIDQDFLNIEAERFLEDHIVARLQPRAIVEGPSFNFGHDRKGSVETLRQFAAKGGYRVELVPAREITNAAGQRMTVTSSLIRSLLAAGNIADAARCLGRPYGIRGTVVHGAGVGQSLGFPTANLDVGDRLIPGDGVYSGFAMVSSTGASRAAISIGRRETFGGGKRV